MDSGQHRQWLAELAAEDARRRRLAEPGLARREAVLNAAPARLESTQAAVQELEAELEGARTE